MIRLAVRFKASAEHRKFVRRFYNTTPSKREAGGYMKCIYGGTLAAAMPTVDLLRSKAMRTHSGPPHYFINPPNLGPAWGFSFLGTPKETKP